MAQITITTTDIFLDTAYAVALSSRRDNLHQQARKLAAEIRAKRIRVITTQAVLTEIGNSFASRVNRGKAVILIAALINDENVSILPFNEQFFEEAFELYQERQDKSWGMTDCSSFVVMRQLGIKEALTADHHFQQAGFRILLSP